MKRVTMFVWNDFLNDARVMKEAETLMRDGLSVTVCALHRVGVTPPKEVLESGIVVVRTYRSIFAPLFEKAFGRDVSGAAQVGRLGRVRVFQLMAKISTRMYAHGICFFKIVLSRPDVVHSHDINTLPTCWLAAKFSGSKLVYDAHEVSTSREGYLGLKRLIYFFEKALMPKADGCITTTNMRAKYFRRVYRIETPLVLQNRPREFLGGSTELIRDYLELTQRWPIVLYQGGLQQGRGLELLVESAASINAVYFVFIGGGRMDAILKARVLELGLSSRVLFIPTVPLSDLPYYTSSADIGVQVLENTCFNHYSTDSNKLFEYIQAGLPVIASNFPEMKKIITTYEVGFAIRAGDKKVLVESIKKLVNDRTMRERFAINSRIVRRELSWESQEEAFITFYRDLLGY